jgi:hypothetical protein
LFTAQSKVEGCNVQGGNVQGGNVQGSNVKDSNVKGGTVKVAFDRKKPQGCSSSCAAHG